MTMRKLVVAVAAALTLGILATPAMADNGKHRGWYKHGGHHHGHHHKHYRGFGYFSSGYVYAPAPVYYPRPVYVPPPVVYSPPPSLTLVFPIH